LPQSVRRFRDQQGSYVLRGIDVTKLDHHNPPKRERCFGRGGIVLDAIDRLSAQVCCLCDRDDIGALAQHVLHRGKLFAAVARFAPAVAFAIGLRVFDTSPLGFFGACGVAAMNVISASLTPSACLGGAVEGQADTRARCAILAIVDLEQPVVAWIIFQDFPTASMVAMPALRSTFSARP
jgi:hypothetical protein